MIKTPQNQKRLTNIQVVWLQKGGKRFEIACYPNKVVNWRAKQEQNLAQVLQIDKIFTDVSKGEVAKQKDLKNVFGAKLSEDEIIMEILNKGEFQQSDKEREGQFENLRLDIANIIVKMTENTKDGNQFPVSMILKAMEECHCKINPQKTAKP